ncbi:MAG: flagellar protein FlgN [Phycisphaerae bacterium]|nr:flagellar protein FlgN [Phycisphaerae bacterium]
MSRTADPLADGFRTIEEILVQQEAAYRILRQLVGKRREAIRTADLATLKTTLDHERKTVARLSELDRKRTEIAVLLARRLGFAVTPQKAPPPVSELAAKAPNGVRERVLAIAARLRDEIAALRHESGIVRNAAEALAQHVAGILQTVTSAFASTKTYGRAGRVATASPIRSIDLTS